jgi:hypothetical protein
MLPTKLSGGKLRLMAIDIRVEPWTPPELVLMWQSMTTTGVFPSQIFKYPWFSHSENHFSFNKCWEVVSLHGVTTPTLQIGMSQSMEKEDENKIFFHFFQKIVNLWWNRKQKVVLIESHRTRMKKYPVKTEGFTSLSFCSSPNQFFGVVLWRQLVTYPSKITEVSSTSLHEFVTDRNCIMFFAKMMLHKNVPIRELFSYLWNNIFLLGFIVCIQSRIYIYIYLYTYIYIYIFVFFFAKNLINDNCNNDLWPDNSLHVFLRL